MTGTVYRTTGSWCLVKHQDNFYDCRMRGKLRTEGIESTNPVAVGDNVEFELENDQEGLVSEILKRSNYMIRKSTNLSKRTQVIAANIDCAFIIVTIDQPVTTTGFIDRMLLTCEAYHIPANLVFNKVDLLDDEQLEYLAKLRRVYESLGYGVFETSTLSPGTLKPLMAEIQGKVCLLSGHSGVGKSTLINCIQPDASLRVNEISSYHGKGQHTTTFAEMFDLDIGGQIIDTPGIKGFGVIDFSKEEIAGYFPEMRALLPDCKFNNCMHVNEPGCAVKEGIEDGTIAQFRYKNYVSMYNDDPDETYRKDDYS